MQYRTEDPVWTQLSHRVLVSGLFSRSQIENMETLFASRCMTKFNLLRPQGAVHVVMASAKLHECWLADACRQNAGFLSQCDMDMVRPTQKTAVTWCHKEQREQQVFQMEWNQF